jgi:hypothetical protein
MNQIITGGSKCCKHRATRLLEGLKAPGNTPDGRAKRPRLMSVEGREIVGPGFSAGPRVCTARPENRYGGRIRQSDLAEKTIAPGTAQNHVGVCRG